MSFTRFLAALVRGNRRRAGRVGARPGRFIPTVQPLEDRAVPAVTAVFNPGSGTLSVFGDSSDNEIVISRDALGVISVNGEIPLAGGLPGGFPTVFNTRSISAFGLSGNDTLRLDEANGPLPAAALFGGDGADVLFAGSGDNVMFGGTGDDVLRGEEGDDVLDGGDGDDILIGGAGDDVLLNGEVEFDE